MSTRTGKLCPLLQCDEACPFMSAQTKPMPAVEAFQRLPWTESKPLLGRILPGCIGKPEFCCCCWYMAKWVSLYAPWTWLSVDVQSALTKILPSSLKSEGNGKVKELFLIFNNRRMQIDTNININEWVTKQLYIYIYIYIYMYIW